MSDPKGQGQDPVPPGLTNFLVSVVCVSGPALVSLIPMAAAPAMPAMAARFASSGDGQLFAQMVMTLPALLLIASAPISGIIASLLGRRIVLLVSLLLFVVGGAGVLVVNEARSLILLRLVLGVAGGGLLTASLALIGDCFAGNHRERILGYATSAASLVAGLALVFGGNLVDAAGWRAPFGLYLLALPVLLLGFFVIPRNEAPAESAPVIKEQGGVGSLLRVSHYYVLLVLLTLGMFTPAIQVPFVLEAKGMTSSAMIGAIISATAFVAMFSAALFGWLRRWITVHGFLAIDALSMGAGIALIAVSPGTAGIFLGCVLIGIGAGMSEPTIASIVFDRTPMWVHGVAMGIIVSALNIGQFINPLTFAPLRDSFGVATSFLVVSAVLSGAGLLIMVTHGRKLIEKRVRTLPVHGLADT